ncbi:D-glycero-beta-D-manno-heptose-7-phosphate kinase [Persicobacter sp. CCB-QB2]|uniref:D-glycero-beta-D-manno-heptose-7-phosphate kinase n=1 Tax=Persicobacter sp. CCB-QB2 TaxID=1561025 RepID=UPI0006A98A3D|nr:D-glycero-beta-D-manno-heptose-7-phosphate kinase [Persicobacter sp. CCB-QB2]
MKYPSLDKLFESFNPLKVLVIGDVMVDSYIWGKVDRISPEAPVPVVNIHKKEDRLGGAANVAKNIQSMGATPILCALVGDDDQGQSFMDLLEARGVSAEGIIKSNHRTTTVKQRVLAGSQQMLRIDTENDQNLNAEEQETLLNRIEEIINGVDVIIFEDYDKGVLNKEVIAQVVNWARAKNIPTVVDPKKRNFMHYQGVTLFKPNLKEIKEGLKIEFNADHQEEVLAAVDQLLKSLQADTALITMSERGVFIKNEKQHVHVPAHIRSISDVSGAGDTVISIASLCLALGLPLDFTASLANLGGGLVCESLGVVPIDKKRLYEEALKNKYFDLLT